MQHAWQSFPPLVSVQCCAGALEERPKHSNSPHVAIQHSVMPGAACQAAHLTLALPAFKAEWCGDNAHSQDAHLAGSVGHHRGSTTASASTHTRLQDGSSSNRTAAQQQDRSSSSTAGELCCQGRQVLKHSMELLGKWYLAHGVPSCCAWLQPDGCVFM
jgi:hypothetical protein